MEPSRLCCGAPFATHIIEKLFTFTNPKGTITNSDLELATSVAAHDVLAHQADINEATIHNLYDNMVMVLW
jgi:hypothetical protein